MKIDKTPFPGVFVIKPRVFEDSRGFFFESYREDTLRNAGIDIKFIQENHSRSGYGVLRGMHFQKPPYAQTKLVRVASGTVIDVIFDLRRTSPTYGQVFKIELSDKNNHQILIPQGFAHGFQVLSKNADFIYKVDNLYNPEYDSGFSWKDSHVFDTWEKLDKEPIISPKDAGLPFWDPAKIIFE